MVEDWLRAVRAAAPVEPREAETVSEYLRRVGRAVDAPDRAEAAVEAYRAATFGPETALDDGQRAALDGLLAVVEDRDPDPAGDAGASPPERGESAGGAPDGSPATDDGAAWATDEDPGGERSPPGTGLEPPVTVPDDYPREPGRESLSSAVARGRWRSGLRLGEVVAVVAVALFVGAVLVAGASAGPAPASGDPVAVGVQGGFSGETGYVATTDAGWTSDRLAGAFEVEWVGDGRVLAAVLDRGRRDCGARDPPCARAGVRVYAPATGAVERAWTRPVPNDTAPPVLTATMLDDGTVVLATPSPGRGGLVAVDAGGEVAWRWNLTAHYGTGPEAPPPGRLSVTDVDHLGGERYLIAVGLTDQVLVYERGTGVVTVVNDDRSSALLDGPHDAEWLGPDRLAVADSRNNRVVVLERGPDGWREDWALPGAGGRRFGFPRDVDVLADGTMLITDSLNDRVVRVARGGAVYRRVRHPIPFAADSRGAPANRRDWEAAAGPASPRVAVLTPVYLEVRSAAGLPHWVDQWLFAGGVVAFVVALAGLTRAGRGRRRG